MCTAHVMNQERTFHGSTVIKIFSHCYELFSPKNGGELKDDIVHDLNIDTRNRNKDFPSCLLGNKVYLPIIVD